MSKRIQTGPEPNIIIETVEGDLRLVGWDNDEILVKTDQDALTLQQEGEQATLSSTADLSLNVPLRASVHIRTVNGDMSVRGLQGQLKVDSVHGDAAIREVGQVSVGAIDADFSLRTAKGDIHVRHVGGDASLREVDGSLILDSVSEDLAVRGVGGDLKVDVDKDVVVHLEPKNGQEYAVVAGDDILLVLPPDANATLTMHGDTINVQWPEVPADDSTSRTVTLGDGAAQIRLDAGGDVLVTNRLDAAESADEFGNFAGMMFDWGNWGREFGERWGKHGSDLGERISRRAEEAARRAERKAAEAARRTERIIERKTRQLGKHGRYASMNWDFGPTAPKPPREPVSDEERKAILQMLADKKITAEEAETLLSALEGGS